MLAIVCCVDGDDVSGTIWAKLFGPEQCILTSAQELLTKQTNKDFPGGLLLVGREPLQQQAVTADASLEDLLQSVMQGLSLDPTTTTTGEHKSNEFCAKELYQQLISNFHTSDLLVCGLGAGAVELAHYFHAKLDTLDEPYLRIDQVENKCSLARVLCTKITEMVDADKHEFLLMRHGKQDIVCFENPRVLGINASPELPVDMLLDLLDLCESSEECERAIDSVKAFKRQVVEFQPFWCMLHICKFLGKSFVEHEEEEDEEEPAMPATTMDEKDEEIFFLRQRLQELELENEDLKFKLRAFVVPLARGVVWEEEENRERVTDLDDRNDIAKRETLRIQSLLLGRNGDATSEEDLQLANSLLKPLHSEVNVKCEQGHVAKSPVLCMCFTFRGGNLVWGQSNHQLCCDNQEQVTLDAPPVYITTAGGDQRLVVGTLSGSIYVFSSSQNDVVLANQQRLASPHRKHLMGLEYDSTCEALYSISRDLKLCLWDMTTLQVVKTLLFDEAQPPECCTSVFVEGNRMLAVAKRNSQALSLVPFATTNTEEQKLCALELGVEETCLSMAACDAQLPILALVTDRGSILVVDVRNGGSRLKSFFGGVVCDEYSRPALVWRGNWLACTSNSPNSILLFAVTNPDQTKPIVLKDEHVASIRTLAFKPVDNGDDVVVLASGAFDKRVIVRLITV